MLRPLALLLAALTIGALAPPADAQTAVRDSVRMDIRIFNNTGRTEAGNGFCEVGIVAIWPNVLQSILGDRPYGYSDYQLVATEGFWVRRGWGEVPQLPPGSALLGHNPRFDGSAYNFNPDHPLPDCSDTLEIIAPIAAGGWTLDGGRPYRITTWYAVYDIPDGTPIALFEWEQADGLAVDFDASFASDQSREIDASAPNGKRPVVAYEWDFGDSQTGSGAWPRHTYAEAGEYAVTLTVTDDDGEETARTDSVTVNAAQLTVAVEASVDEASIGDEIEIVATVTNTGTETVYDLEVPRLFTPLPRIPEDQIILDHYVRSARVEPTDLSSNEPDAERRGELAPGVSFEVRRTYVVETAFQHEFLNGDPPIPFEAPVQWQTIAVLSVDAAGDKVDIVNGCEDLSCTNSTLIKPPANPDLRMTLTARPDAVTVGTTFDVRVAVRNEGFGPADDVGPTAPLTLSSADGGAARLVSGPLPATLGRLDAGETDTLVYRVEADAVGTLAFSVPVEGLDEEGNSVSASPECTVTQLRLATSRAHAEGCGAEVRDVVFTWTQSDLPTFQLAFEAATTTAPSGRPVVAWRWQFGDGVRGTGSTEVHRYDDYGPADVTLTIEDDQGVETAVTETVEIERFGVIVEDDGTVDLVSGPEGPLRLTAADLPEGFPTIVTVGQSVEGGGGMGTVSTGDPNVLFEDRPVSRVNDQVRAIQDYGGPLPAPHSTWGPIVEGESRALVNGIPLASVPGQAVTCCDEGSNSAVLRPGLASIHVMQENAIRMDMSSWPPTTQLNAVIERLGGAPVAQTPLTSPVDPSETRLEVANADDFEIGDPILIVDPDGNAEVSEVSGFGSIFLATPLQRRYPFGSLVSAIQPLAVASSEDAPRPETASVAVYPNPASRVATLRYAVPATGAVRVTMYDTLGREVHTLVDDELAAGIHTLPLSTTELASGVYLIRLSVGSEVAIQNVTVVR